MSSARSIDRQLMIRRVAVIACGLILSLAMGILPVQLPRDLVLALLIGSAALFFLVARPLWILGLLVLYVPFHGYLRPVITSELIPVSEATKGISLIGGVKDFLIVALFIYAIVYIVREHCLIKLTAVDRLMILFIAWTGFEIARAAFMGRSLVAAVLDVRGDVEYMVLYWVVATFIRNVRQMSRLVQAAVCGAGLAGVFSAAWAQAGQRVVGEGARIRRAFGTFGQAQTNVYGVYMAMVAILVVALLAHSRQRVMSKIAALAILVISVANVFLTQSRRGFLTLVFGGLFCLYLLYRRWPAARRWLAASRRRGRVFKMLPFALFVMAVLVLTMVPGRWSLRRWGLPTWDTFKAIMAGERFGRYDTVTGYSVEPRLVEIARTLRALSGRYLLGDGPSSDVAAELFIHRGVEFHNYYLGLWVKLGLVGLLIYVALLVAIIRCGVTVYASVEDPSLKGLSLGILSSLVGMSVAALLGSQTSSMQIGILSWIMLGILGAMPSVSERGAAPLGLSDGDANRGSAI